MSPSVRMSVTTLVTTTALDRVRGVRWFVATRAFGFGCGLARESVGGVGFEVFVRFVCLSCVSGSPRCF